jgi:hypothetical protein
MSTQRTVEGLEHSESPMSQFKHSAGVVPTFGDRAVTLIVNGRAVYMLGLLREASKARR